MGWNYELIYYYFNKFGGKYILKIFLKSDIKLIYLVLSSNYGMCLFGNFLFLLIFMFFDEKFIIYYIFGVWGC